MLSLRSKITQQVLAYFVLHQGNELYINEIARRFRIDRGNLVRKLRELEAEGLLASRWRGHQRYYRLNPTFPLLKEYQQIIQKTVGLEHLLKKALLRVKGIVQAFLFGSYARDAMDLSSDLDVLVIGHHHTVDLQRAIAAVQKQIDREINVISLSPAEYTKKRRHDLFFRSILQQHHVRLL